MVARVRSDFPGQGRFAPGGLPLPWPSPPSIDPLDRLIANATGYEALDPEEQIEKGWLWPNGRVWHSA